MSLSDDIMKLRVGCGFDAHAFCEGRPLVMGGIILDSPLGLAGHSDADVLVHAIIDGILGGAGLGDIGILFPDTDSAYKNISSITLLERVVALLKEKNIRIINIDSVIICQKPKISPYVSAMKEKLSAVMSIPSDVIGIKGKTTEKLGFTGRSEGIAVQCSVLLYKE
jgi:2-C-methyl-D-erythritol 2,4-cyclodiphosphate synthase